METIFLDFDGVLFNSVKEAYLLARYAYYGIKVTDEINENHFQQFKKYRYLINNSWQIFYLMELIEKSPIDYEIQYFNMIKNRDEKKDNDFDIKYQKMRKIIIEKNYNFWKSLEKPYNFFYEIKQIKDDFNFIIVSTKNEFAIKNKLNEYGFNIEEEKIKGKETIKKYKKKSCFIIEYINLHKLKNAIFIDDNKDNLAECENIPGLVCLQAKWGYVPPEVMIDNSFEIINRIKE